ncbi:MAG: replication initiation protein [Gammaproteobacteria bacterium]
MQLVICEEKNLELKKHVNAIHCTNNLTLVQRKLFNALLFNAYPALPHKTRFQIQIKELCGLIGYNSNDYGKLKRALLGLITIAIEWNVINGVTGQEKLWKASSILASATLQNGVCEYEYSDVTKELLYRPDVYGRIDLRLISQFKSGYGLALYENCIRYQKLKQTPWFPIDIFRKLMGVTEKQYPAFKDFKKRVVDIAVNEVNAISSVSVFPEIERKNRQVTSIRFQLVKNISENQQEIQKNLLDQELLSILESFGFSQQTIESDLSQYDPAYIKEKVEMMVCSRSFLDGRIPNPIGYLITALKKNHKPSKSSATLMKEQRQHLERDEKTKKIKEEDRQNRYSAYIRKKIDDYLAALNKEQYEVVVHSFEESIKKDRYFTMQYAKDKFESKSVKAMFYSHIQTTKQVELGTLLTYEDFLALVDEYN